MADDASASHDNANVSHDRSIASPDNASVSHHNASVSNHNASVTPDEGIATPDESVVMRHEGNVTPDNASVSDDNASVLADDAPVPPAADDVLIWLASVRPAAALAILRERDFAPLAARAFAGFQANPKGFANALVRRRLAAEAVKDSKFADKIRLLADQTPPPPVIVAEISRPESAPQTPKDDSAREEKRRREREDGRRERDELKATAAQLQAALTASEDTRAQAETARDDLRQQMEVQARRLSRLERQAARWQAERREMLAHPPAPKFGGVRVENASPSQTPPNLGAGGRDLPNPWRDAVRHLLDKNKNEQALTMTADILRASPDEPDALEIAARALDAKGERDASASVWTQLLDAHLTQGRTTSAMNALRGLLAVVPERATAEKPLRRLLARLRPDDLEPLRLMLTRLRGQSPDAFAWLAWRLTSLTPTLAETLMPPPGALGPDDLLPLPGLSVTARRLLEAVAANEIALVDAARAALAASCGTQAEEHARIVAALERVAGEEISALTPLTRAPRGAVVVDASNAAWFDQESLSAGRPRLRPILELRRELRRRGYFPVVLLADAPLPYTIDDPEALRAMRASGEIELVDSGVDADEVLLREAKRLNALLVTNDYMNDWDPQGEVEKIGYIIAPGGAHLLF